MSQSGDLVIIGNENTKRNSIKHILNDSVIRIKKTKDFNVDTENTRLQAIKIHKRKLTRRVDLNKSVDHFRLTNDFYQKKFDINDFSRDLYIKNELDSNININDGSILPDIFTNESIDKSNYEKCIKTSKSKVVFTKNPDTGKRRYNSTINRFKSLPKAR